MKFCNHLDRCQKIEDGIVFSTVGSNMLVVSPDDGESMKTPRAREVPLQRHSPHSFHFLNALPCEEVLI